MRYILCIVILLLSVVCGKAQNEVFSRQYFLNNYLANPAVGGAYDYMDLRLSYSRQWTDIDRSPSSMILSFNTNLSREKDVVLRYSNRNQRYELGRANQGNAIRRIKHGVGTRVIYDKVNVFSNTTASLSYACHIPLSASYTASVGIAGGMVWSALDLGNQYIPDVSDPVLNVQKRKEIIPMVDAGVWIYSPTLYLGLSMSTLMSNPYDGEDKAKYLNYYATAGWKYVPSDYFTLVPSLMYRKNAYNGGMFDFNLRTVFRETVWIGATYRDFKEFSFHVGATFRELVEIHYTCDLNRKAFGLSHEVGIAYRIWSRARECQNRWYFL